MSVLVQTVLLDMGWDPQLAVPGLNASNRALVEEICKKDAELLELNNRTGKNEEKKQLVDRASKGAEQELENAETLFKAKHREIELEKHLTALTERDTSRLNQQIPKFENEIRSSESRKDTIQKSLFKIKVKLEKFRDQMNWDQQNMDVFLEESVKKDEETMTIIKYSQQDEKKIKALTLQLDKMTLEASEKLRALNRELTETMSAQVALDKTAENLQKAHLEMRRLTDQLENTVQQMKQQDAAMQQCSLQLTQGNENIRERNASITEMKQLLDTQINNNKGCEKKITGTRRQVERLQQDLREKENKCVELQDKLDGCKYTLDSATARVKSLRTQMSKMKKDVLDNDNKLKDAKSYNAALEEKLKTVTQTALSEEESAAQMDRMLKEEEQSIKELDIQLRDLMGALNHQRESLRALKTKEKDAIADISKSRAAIASMQSQQRKLDKELKKQQGTIDKQDEEIEGLTRKLAHLQNNTSSDEKEILDVRIAELTKDLEEKKNTARMLTSALKKCEVDIHIMKQKKEETEAQQNDLNKKVEELRMFCSSSEKELKRLKLRKQDTLVSHNMMKLEVARTRDLLYDKSDCMLSLKKRKLELQKTMKERDHETQLHMDMISMDIKSRETERKTLSAELGEKLRKIELMKRRFETFALLVAPEVESENAQASYIIKAALEKEELQRKGDDLDAKLRRMELETKVFQNTIQLFKDSNSAIHESLSTVHKSKYQRKGKLEEQLRACEETLKFKRQQVHELQEDIQDMSDAFEGGLQQQQETKDEIAHKQRLVEKANKDWAVLQEKIKRATTQCSTLTREIRSEKQTKAESHEEQDITLKEVKELNRSIKRMLNEATANEPELRSALEIWFQQAALPPPFLSPTPSSSQSSMKSSVSSSASFRSPGSSASSRSSGSTRSSQTMKVVSLDLNEPVTSSSRRTLEKP